MPNLNVAYEKVFIVEWDGDNCVPVLVEREDYYTGNVVLEVPTSIIVDFESPENKPAFSFYSRYHLKLVKIPEILNSIQSMEDQIGEAENGEKICCQDAYGSCKGKAPEDELRECGTKPSGLDASMEADVKAIEDEKNILQGAYDDWLKVFEKEEESRMNAIEAGKSISDWFDDDEIDQIVTDDDFNNDLNGMDLQTALVPETLIKDAEYTENGEALLELANQDTSGEGRDTLRKVKRVQFVGDAGTLEMSLSKAAMQSYQQQNCDIPLALIGKVGGVIAGGGLALGLTTPAILIPLVTAALITNAAGGCNYELDAGIDSKFQTDISVLGAAVEVKPELNFAIHIEHTSVITDSEESETSISFAFGDPDDGDEFVVDIYHDPLYKSFVFDTISGISRCHNEDNTIAGEDPRLTLVSTPSKFIFPDEAIEFEVQLLNTGEHVYSYFLIAQDMGEGGSALATRLDNTMTLGYYGSMIKLDKKVGVNRKVRVYRGPDGYDFNPVQLVLKSKCEQDMDSLEKFDIEPLYNYIDPVTFEKRLRWLEPCPTVEWAGEIKRDQTFLLNTQSDDEDNISVVVFNPLGGKKKTFKDMLEPNGRLQNVYLRYRQEGTQTWNEAKNATFGDVDFAQDPINEDSFGYATSSWSIGKLVDATYEIIVETECANVGGPDEFSSNRADIITGVIDRSRPEQYGNALPLREDVIVGEEITVVFTEDLDCSLPLSFDIQMTIEGIDQPLTKHSNLLVHLKVEQSDSRLTWL